MVETRRRMRVKSEGWQVPGVEEEEAVKRREALRWLRRSGTTLPRGPPPYNTPPQTFILYQPLLSVGSLVFPATSIYFSFFSSFLPSFFLSFFLWFFLSGKKSCHTKQWVANNKMGVTQENHLRRWQVVQLEVANLVLQPIAFHCYGPVIRQSLTKSSWVYHLEFTTEKGENGKNLF